MTSIKEIDISQRNWDFLQYEKMQNLPPLTPIRVEIADILTNILSEEDKFNISVSIDLLLGT